MPGFDFTTEQIERYSRHILLKEVGVEGQRRLLNSSALVVGAGGLGSPIIQYLAAAGVGRIGIADGDVVELSNLQRQIVHGTADVGRSKAVSAAEFVGGLNPDCRVDIIAERLTAANTREAVAQYDVVLDGSDNFPTRFLVADACWLEGVPLVSGAVLRFEGQLLTVLPGGASPCYRCYVPEPPPPGVIPSCREAGILGAVVGVIGTLQAVEALNLLLGFEVSLADRLLIYEALDCTFTKAKRGRDPECALCGPDRTITDLVEYEVSCETDAEGAAEWLSE
ncbi:MAG: HesA/MoeB/ThiF family protein [Armatimonadetes bacterium]|nr:HesA/MoeB/ThiF family protein [Armatimonadota bacterium]